MTFVQTAVYIHVAAGTLWTLVSLAIAVTRRGPPTLLVLQIGTASVALIVGILLWHARHAWPFGPTEHLLVVGTLCAFIALGLQIGVIAQLLSESETHLAAGGLVLYRASTVLLVLGAGAMVGSLYA